MRDQRTLIAALLLLVGLIALAVGVIYLTVDARSLPSILGQLHNYSGHRSKRGVAAVIVGGILLVVGGGMLVYKPSPRTVGSSGPERNPRQEPRN